MYNIEAPERTEAIFRSMLCERQRLRRVHAKMSSSWREIGDFLLANASADVLAQKIEMWKDLAKRYRPLPRCNSCPACRGLDNFEEMSNERRRRAEARRAADRCVFDEAGD
jgi:hypothetical protein